MSEIPLGLCQCGCGGATNIARWNNQTNRHVAGRPLRFLKGHYRKEIVTEYRRTDQGIEIPLTRGLVAIIDEADLPIVVHFTWSALQSDTTFYAVTNLPGGRRARRQVYMHRMILGTSPGLDTDHFDGNGLNNRRANLRSATHVQNMANYHARPLASSGFLGVHMHREKFAARVSNGPGPRVNVGSFDTPEEAARAYDRTKVALHGPFARTNAMEGRV